MNKTYYSKTIDFSIRKLIDGNIENQIKEYLRQLDLFQEEIDYWFKVFNDTGNLKEKNYLRKPICIELFEYSHYLKRLKKLINGSSKEINRIFEKKRKCKPIKLLNQNLEEILKQSINYLNDPRRQFAAHRYTKKNKDFLTINEIVKISSKLSDQKIEEIKNNLYIVHQKIKEWFDNYQNYLIILEGIIKAKQ